MAESKYALPGIASPMALAKALGVPLRTAENWMRGTHPMPAAMVQPIAKAFGLTSAQVRELVDELWLRCRVNGHEAAATVVDLGDLSGAGYSAARLVRAMGALAW
jgi:DNA-binding transcriptional regulator YdaS (Cro superfamily)